MYSALVQSGICCPGGWGAPLQHTRTAAIQGQAPCSSRDLVWQLEHNLTEINRNFGVPEAGVMGCRTQVWLQEIYLVEGNKSELLGRQFFCFISCISPSKGSEIPVPVPNWSAFNGTLICLFQSMRNTICPASWQDRQKCSRYSGGDIEGQVQTLAHVLDLLLIPAPEQLDLGGS